MLYCKNCECIIVPGRAFLTAGGYYCRRCMERMNHGVFPSPELKSIEERGHGHDLL